MPRLIATLAALAATVTPGTRPGRAPESGHQTSPTDTAATIGCVSCVPRPDGDSLPRHILLGAALQEPGDTLLATGAPAGARITRVIPGSSAEGAGLQLNDVIVRVGDQPVTSVVTALAALKLQRAGARVSVRLWRAGGTVDTAFTGVERPRESSNEFVVTYATVAAAGGRHRVLITRPSDSQRHPAVLLIGGIGCYSIDQAGGPNAYRDVAYHFTRRGFVTIRVEKLGVGDSDGASCLTTDLDTEMDGYRQALRAARRSPWVDPARIVVFGHSIGGVEAPVLAGERAGGPPVAGVIVLETAGIGWYEYELANLRRQLVVGDTPPDSIEIRMKEKIACMYRLLIRAEPRSALLTSNPECARHIDYPASDAYMQQVAARDPAANWRDVEAPVLLLHGASDFITSASEHAQLAEMLRRMRPGRAVTYAEVPEFDHYMSRQASERASATDPVTGLSRPYYGAPLEALMDPWLDRVVGAAGRPAAPGPG